MTEISLVVPAYNEAGIIASTVCELDAFMTRELPTRSFEIVVVDDGSSDGTAEGLDQLAMPSLRVIRHARNKGRGAAIRTGLAASKGALVCTLDADLSYSPAHIPCMLAPLDRGEADIVLASAYHPQGAVKNVPLFRAKLSSYGNQLLSVGVRGRLHTLTCMVRAYRREVIDQLELISDGKDIHIEIVQKAVMFGFRIVEVPATLDWRDRQRAKRLGRGGRLPLLAMSGTIVSHLVYNYVLRPGAMLIVPVLLLGLVILVGSMTLAYSWISHTAAMIDQGFFPAIYGGLRETLIDGALTMAITGGSLFALLIFLAFYFQSHQSKKQFEELYILLARANDRLKQLEREKAR